MGKLTIDAVSLHSGANLKSFYVLFGSKRIMQEYILKLIHSIKSRDTIVLLFY